MFVLLSCFCSSSTALLLFLNFHMLQSNHGRQANSEMQGCDQGQFCSLSQPSNLLFRIQEHMATRIALLHQIAKEDITSVFLINL